MNRREFLRTAGGAAGAVTTTSAVSGAAAAQEGGGGSGPIDYGGYLDDAGGWSEGSTADMTGNNQVTIKVGPGGENVYDPVAVHVDPGTKIIWQWEGPGHNVQAEDGQFESEIKGSGTFEYTAEEEGVIPYFCQPHKSVGMKGAIAVGNVPRKSPAAAAELKPEEMGVPIQPHYVGIGAVLMMMSSLVFTFYLLKYGESAHTKGGNN
ncbi:plastocyanin/azurin family copper-binding protein [Halocatena marina]|uniref:Plastocyanin/azurin family copper-binding protein n=1 Tax=Halocatena marina TaxID=2934937 RepID=A0ABD5YNN8_9EURY|nr:plastocyanin/azurin family copper-binding protein [Halocatena marina]